MHEEEVDLDEHWAYTITGNWRAINYCENLLKFCLDAMTDSEEKEFKNNNITLVEALRIKTVEETEELRDKKIKIRQIVSSLIDRCYDKLVRFVRSQNSRLAYMVFGVFLLKYGGKMTKDMREEILRHSEWGCEKHQLQTIEERELRKRYLIEFRGAIKGYIAGVPTLISEKTLSDVYANHGPYDLSPIKYDIQ